MDAYRGALELDAIVDYFSNEVPKNAGISIVLLRGLGIIRHEDRKLIEVRQEQLYMGMPWTEVEGIFEKCQLRVRGNDALLKFKTRDGYRLNLMCSQIADYEFTGMM